MCWAWSGSKLFDTLKPDTQDETFVCNFSVYHTLLYRWWNFCLHITCCCFPAKIMHICTCVFIVKSLSDPVNWFPFKSLWYSFQLFVLASPATSDLKIVIFWHDDTNADHHVKYSSCIMVSNYNSGCYSKNCSRQQQFLLAVKMFTCNCKMIVDIKILNM